MAVSWYYAHDGARRGPVSRDDLRLALDQGEIDRQSLVWREGLPQWQALDSVEDLQPLLEHLPPPLPSEPPPLPSAPPPLSQASALPATAGTTAAGTTAADSQDGSRSGDQRSETARLRRRGKVMAVLGDWLRKTVEWLGGKIGNTLWSRLFDRPAVVTLVLVPCLVVGVVYAVKQLPPKEPQTAAAMGQVRIDANPWGRIDWIRGPSGKKLDLPEGRTTPFVTTLPVGSYQAQVGYAHAQTTDLCDLRVEPDQLATCWLDLAPVDAKSYFQKLGW